jgi:hypothetical protein
VECVAVRGGGDEDVLDQTVEEEDAQGRRPGEGGEEEEGKGYTICEASMLQATLAFEAFALLAEDASVGFDLAKKYMEEFLCEQLAYDNALIYLAASYRFKTNKATAELNTLLDWHEVVCLQYARSHARHVLETDGLFALSPHLLKRLVREDRLCAAEDDLFRAVLRWAMYRVQREENVEVPRDLLLAPVERGAGAGDSIDVQSSLNLSTDLDVSLWLGGSMLGGGGGSMLGGGGGGGHLSVNDSLNAFMGWLPDGFNEFNGQGLGLGRGAPGVDSGADGEGVLGTSMSDLETARRAEERNLQVHILKSPVYSDFVQYESEFLLDFLRILRILRMGSVGGLQR